MEKFKEKIVMYEEYQYDAFPSKIESLIELINSIKKEIDVKYHESITLDFGTIALRVYYVRPESEVEFRVRKYKAESSREKEIKKLAELIRKYPKEAKYAMPN